MDSWGRAQLRASSRDEAESGLEHKSPESNGTPPSLSTCDPLLVPPEPPPPKTRFPFSKSPPELWLGVIDYDATHLGYNIPFSMATFPCRRLLTALEPIDSISTLPTLGTGTSEISRFHLGYRLKSSASNSSLISQKATTFCAGTLEISYSVGLVDAPEELVSQLLPTSLRAQRYDVRDLLLPAPRYLGPIKSQV
ncbi:hypothetical protein ONZ45_g7541 [Pleurotus djamor]|nr:hypothetical protein ONZ45_g7541 [Pleurotus djamor]